VPYATGTLTAKGIKDGKVVRTVEIQTTDSPAKLALVADRMRTANRSSDVAHITVQVLDAKGRIVPTADNGITFAIQGAGRILGVDNGRPESHESYQEHSREAFHGLALVVLQSTGAPGRATLSASSPSLAPAQIEIEVG
jgi:beta-galactosidase